MPEARTLCHLAEKARRRAREATDPLTSERVTDLVAKYTARAAEIERSIWKRVIVEKVMSESGRTKG
jgi:hypothetical protein